MLFTHLIDHIIINILYKNEFDTFIQIFKKLKLNIVQKMNYENYF